MGSSGAETAASTTALNCISLSDPDIHNSVSLLKQACVDSGFFYVIDHGISQEFMDEVFAQSKRFFDLPLNEKMKLLRNEKHRGYTPILDQMLDRDNQADGDYKEGYYIGVEVPEDDPKAEKPFFGPNIWPSTEILPGWRKIMEQYHSGLQGVAKKVARIIGLALGLDANFFDQPEILGDPIATLRLLHYEGVRKVAGHTFVYVLMKLQLILCVSQLAFLLPSGKASNPLKGINGAGAHTDFGFITLLATDDVVGLQICKDRDAQPRVWEYVSPLKGGFIVNLGDMLERWSNCIFRSTLHRVVVDGQERYSIAYFGNPSHECLVECLSSCTSEANPPKFPPITCPAYLSQRYKDTHVDLSSYDKRQTY